MLTHAAAQPEAFPNDGHIERIFCGDKLSAIIIREKLPQSGYNFVSHQEDSLQVGVNHYNPGAIIKPHYHLPVPRSLNDTLEVLHIDSGKCVMTLFDDEQNSFHETELLAGDTVVLISGGHGFKILEPTRIMEVKQGPYLGPQKDKVVFQGDTYGRKTSRI